MTKHQDGAAGRMSQSGQARRRFQNDESGATAIEYALVAGLIFLAIVSSLSAVGVELVAVFVALAAAY